MRFKNITRVSDHFEIDPQVFIEHGAVNAILDFDSRYFIDPLLLNSSNVEVIRTDGVDQLNKVLVSVFRLLNASQREDDPAWKGASKLLNGKEFPAISLGYGGTRTTGSNLDIATAQELLRTAKEVIQLGVTDPDIFLMMPLLIEGVGPDTISDITASAIRESLASFSESVFAMQNHVEKEVFRVGERDFQLPRHPFQTQRGPLVLVPSDVVAELPIATDWSEVAQVAEAIQQIRERFERVALSVFAGEAKSNAERKANARNAVTNVEGFAVELVEIISTMRAESLPARREPGLVALTRYADDERLYESQFEAPKNATTASEAREIVLKIVSDFKFLIEERRMSSLLYGSDGKPFREEVAQKLFFMVAYAHCKAWNLDLNPEAETGNGPVDFKFSVGFNCRIVVEIKLSTNKNAVHGYETQLQRYMGGEETEQGIFVMINVGSIGKKWDRIVDLADRYGATPFFVDGIRRSSASKQE